MPIHYFKGLKSKGKRVYNIILSSLTQEHAFSDIFMLRLSSMLLVIVSLEVSTVVLFDDRNIFNKRQQWGLDEHYLFPSIRDELDTLHVADGFGLPQKPRPHLTQRRTDFKGTATQPQTNTANKSIWLWAMVRIHVNILRHRDEHYS